MNNVLQDNPTIGLVGWRGMVGSVLMERMLAEGDFNGITPVFFQQATLVATLQLLVVLHQAN